MDIRPNLGAGSNGGPGVHHGPRSDPGADVDIAGHHHHPFAQEGAVSGNGMGHDPHTGLGVVFLQGHLVVELEGSARFHLHLPHREIEDHGLLDPFVHDPISFDGLSAPQDTAVERIQYGLHRLAPQFRLVPCGLDDGPGRVPFRRSGEGGVQ